VEQDIENWGNSRAQSARKIFAAAPTNSGRFYLAVEGALAGPIMSLAHCIPQMEVLSSSRRFSKRAYDGLSSHIPQLEVVIQPYEHFHGYPTFHLFFESLQGKDIVGYIHRVSKKAKTA